MIFSLLLVSHPSSEKWDFNRKILITIYSQWGLSDQLVCWDTIAARPLIREGSQGSGVLLMRGVISSHPAIFWQKVWSDQKFCCQLHALIHSKTVVFGLSTQHYKICSLAHKFVKNEFSSSCLSSQALCFRVWTTLWAFSRQQSTIKMTAVQGCHPSSVSLLGSVRYKREVFSSKFLFD